MGRNNDVYTVDEIIDLLIEESKKGPLKRSVIKDLLTKRDLLMQNSKYNKNKGKKVTTITLIQKKKQGLTHKS